MNRNAVLATAIVTAVIVGLLVLLLGASPGQRTSSVNFEIVGQVAPPVEGDSLFGDRFDLREHRGEWVVVNFFASWCVGCRVEHPELVEFTNRHADDGTQLVSVMFSDTEQAARSFFEDLGGEWPTLITDTGPIVLDYGVTAVPETVLVAPTGRVVQKWVATNGVTADQIDEAIATFEGEG